MVKNQIENKCNNKWQRRRLHTKKCNVARFGNYLPMLTLFVSRSLLAPPPQLGWGCLDLKPGTRSLLPSTDNVVGVNRALYRVLMFWHICSRFDSLTFKKRFKVLSYNVAKYVVGWLFYVLQDGEKNDGYISKCFFVIEERGIQTQTYK